MKRIAIHAVVAVLAVLAVTPSASFASTGGGGDCNKRILFIPVC